MLGKNLFKGALIAMGFAAAVAGAETSTTAPSSSTLSTSAAPSESKLIGNLEFRPSWTSQSGEVHSEDTVELGYQFNKNLQVMYTQWLLSNMYNPKSSEGTNGSQIRADDGLFRVRAKNLWNSGNTSLRYQGRLYMPTRSDKREAGFLTAFRNYFTLGQKISEPVTLEFSVVPELFAYDRAGYKEAASPVFETMFVANADVKITSNLSFAFPIFMQYTKYREFAAAANSNALAYTLSIWPELDYNIGDNAYVGVSYYSDNLMKADGRGFDIGAGLEKGVTQLVFGATL